VECGACDTLGRFRTRPRAYVTTEEAEVLIREISSSSAVARQTLAVAREATESLVGSERFQVLAASLAPALERHSWNYGPEVERFLGAADQQLAFDFGDRADVDERGRRVLWTLDLKRQIGRRAYTARCSPLGEASDIG
jgi:hypothetical protein